MRNNNQCKRIMIIKEVSSQNNYYNIKGTQGSCFSIKKNKVTKAIELLEAGRLLCITTNQIGLGQVLSVFIRIELDDFSKDGFFMKEYSFDIPRMEELVDFVLLYKLEETQKGE